MKPDYMKILHETDLLLGQCLSFLYLRPVIQSNVVASFLPIMQNHSLVILEYDRKLEVPQTFFMLGMILAIPMQMSCLLWLSKISETML